MSIILKKILILCIRIAELFIGLPSKKSKSTGNQKKILVLMTNWLGDTFWAMQVISELKEQYPDSEIYAGCKSFSRLLLKGILPNEKVIILDSVISDRKRERFSFFSFLKSVSEIKKYDFDLSIDLVSNSFSIAFLRISGIPEIIGGGNDAFRSLYSNHLSSEKLHNIHLCKKPWFILCQILPDITIPDKLTPPACSHKKNLDAKYAVIVPGAGWSTKKIPPKLLIDAGEHLISAGLKVYCAVSEKESDEADLLKSKCKDIIIFQKSLQEVFGLISNAELYIGGDTGLTHIAAAFNTNILALSCPSNPIYSFPVGKSVRLLRSECPIMKETDTEQCRYTLNCTRKEWMNITGEQMRREIDLLLNS